MSLEDFKIEKKILIKYFGTESVVTIPDGVEIINNEAFKNCLDAEVIIISEGVKQINKFAFSYCTNLKKIVLPNSLSLIDTSCFYYCTSLETIEIKQDNQNFVFKKGVLYSKNKKTLYFYLPSKKAKSFTVPGSVRFISEYSFACSLCEKVKVPNKVRWIANYAFTDSKLESISLSKSLTTITTGSFQYTNLKSIVIPEGVTSICENAFLQTKLKKIILPSTLVNISSGGLVTNEGVNIVYKGEKSTWESITLSESSILTESTIKVVGRKKAWNEEQLKYYTVESSHEKHAQSQMSDFVIKEGVLEAYLGNDHNIYVPHSVNKLSSSFKCNDNSQMYKINFGNSVYEFERNSLRSFTNLTSIIFPTNLYSISPYALADCGTLNHIVIPKTVNNLYDSFTGYKCNQLSELSVEKSCENYYSKNGFVYAKKDNRLIAYATGKVTADIKISNKTKIIGSFVFKLATNIRTIVLPKKLKVIKNSAFSECRNLKTVKMNKKLEVIEAFAFASCNNLETIDLPVTIKQIDPNAFEGCTNLKKIRYLGSKIMWDEHPNLKLAIPNNVTMIFKK